MQLAGEQVVGELRAPGGATGWLKGLREPHVARALALMHESCAEPWTVESLARAVGLSRASFAARFTEAVGEAPMHYLLGRRMLQVMQLLGDRRLSLAGVAERVGYGSEASLSAAFKRYTGLSPGDYRRRQQHQ